MNTQTSIYFLLSIQDLYSIAKQNVAIWSQAKQAMCPPTIDNMFAGILAELTVAKELHSQGYSNIKCNGVTDYLLTIQNNKPTNTRKPDITCLTPEGKFCTIEVKSGRPERYPHRQFIKKQIESYQRDKIHLVYWVDVSNDDTAHVFKALTISEILNLPLKKNFRGRKCHTLTGGY